MPEETPTRVIDYYDAVDNKWWVKLIIWTPSGEIVELKEERDVFPSEFLIAQAVLVS